MSLNSVSATHALRLQVGSHQGCSFIQEGGGVFQSGLPALKLIGISPLNPSTPENEVKSTMSRHHPALLLPSVTFPLNAKASSALQICLSEDVYSAFPSWRGWCARAAPSPILPNLCVSSCLSPTPPAGQSTPMKQAAAPMAPATTNQLVLRLLASETHCCERQG